MCFVCLSCYFLLWNLLTLRLTFNIKPLSSHNSYLSTVSELYAFVFNFNTDMQIFINICISVISREGLLLQCGLFFFEDPV